MPDYRIIAYTMHEHEQRLANNLLSDKEITEGYIIGTASEADIKKLEDAGLIVDKLMSESYNQQSGSIDSASPQFEPDTPSTDTIFTSGPVILGDTIPGIDFEIDFPATSGDTESPAEEEQYFKVKIKDYLLDKWKTELLNHSEAILENLGDRTYKIKSTVAQIGLIQQLPFVIDATSFHQRDVNLPVNSKRSGTAIPNQPVISTYDIRVHAKEDLTMLMKYIEKNNIKLVGSGRKKVRIVEYEGSSVLRSISNLSYIHSIEKYIQPKLYHDAARRIINLETAAGGIVNRLVAETGNGITIGVADTGIDDAHPDFQGRIAGINAMGRINDHSDPDGHGTHVSGSVLSDGNASGGELAGVAPNANLYFQSVMDGQGRLGGLPIDIYDLFDDAYKNGARIHNNSWGADTKSHYTTMSLEADEFAYDHLDMLLIIAAGNEGDDNTNFHTPPGSVDWLSIGSPATSKNALTVGASRSDRIQLGLSHLEWGQAWPQSFPNGPIAGQNISGDPEALAAFSSRGPSDDERIKPDLVAPGTNIASTKSSIAPLGNFWGSYPGHNNRYGLMGGTSMAAPIVAGCAALAREYYVNTRNHEPSGALLKATLINGTRALTGLDAMEGHAFLPNYHQGFGCVNVSNSIPNPSQDPMGLEFIDNWKNRNNILTFSGDRTRYRFTIKNGTPLNICLVWTDPPGRSIQNNINIILEKGNTKWVGNENLPRKLTQTDRINNVEIIRIDDPQPGDYNIVVIATNFLITTGQPYALIVTADFDGGNQLFIF